MPQASIRINTIVGSNDDLPLNVVVTLDNDNAGGEATYFWEIVSQPAGTADTLSSSSAPSVTFTPRKEGSYLVRLTVNGTLIDTVVAAVRQLKTRVRVPASGETDEVDPAGGWSLAADEVLQLTEQTRSDPGFRVGTADSALTTGAIVRVSTTQTIKSGLPGQEVLTRWALANAATAATCRGTLGVVVGKVGGGAISTGDLVLFRVFGLVQGASVGGSPSVGAEVFVDDAGAFNTTPGTVRRLVGHIVAGAGPYSVEFDGSAPDPSGFVPVTRTLQGAVPIAVGGAYTPQALNANLVFSYAFPGETHGGISFRGASGWQFLPASTAGYVLTSAGPGADPVWAPASGGISGITLNTSAPLTGGTGLGTSFTLGLSYTSTLTLSGSDLTVVYGTTAGTAAEGNDTRIVNAVQNTRQVLTNAPLGGGGALNADLTLTWSVSGEAHGDLVYRGASTWQRLTAGTPGQFLQSNGAGAAPSWATIPAGTGDLLYLWADLHAGTSVLTAGTLTPGSIRFLPAEFGLPGSGQPLYLRILHRRFSGTSWCRYRLYNSTSGLYVQNLDGGGNDYIEFSGTSPSVEEKSTVDLTGHTNFSASADENYELQVEVDVGVVAVAERAYFSTRVSTAGGSYTLPFFLVGESGDGPSGSSPAFSSIAAAQAAAPDDALIVLMPGTYVESPTLTGSQRLVSWAAYNGETTPGGAVRIDGTVTINPASNGKKPAVLGIRVAPTTSGNGILITGSNSCEVDLSGTQAIAPAGDDGVLVNNTNAATRVYARGLRAESALSRAYHATSAAHTHKLDVPELRGFTNTVEANTGATITIQAAPYIGGKLVANGGLIVARYCYQNAGTFSPFRIGGGGTLVAEFHRVDSTGSGDLVEYTGAGLALYFYSQVSIFGSIKQTYASGVVPTPLTTLEGLLEQTLTVTGTVNESTSVIFLNHATVKIEATLPDPTRRLSRLIYAKNTSIVAHDLKAVGGTTVEGASSITLAPGASAVLWAAFGTTDYKVLAAYIPGTSGTVPTSFVALASKWLTAAASTTAELAGGSSWQPAEHDYSGARTVKFRAVLAATSVSNNVRVRLWSVTDGAYVQDLDGSGNDYMQTNSLTGAVLTSPDLKSGHTYFTVGAAGRIYEVHVQSTDVATQALLYKAEFVIG